MTKDTVLGIEDKIRRLQEKKERLIQEEKELREKQSAEEIKKKEDESRLTFKGKTESDFVISNACNVMALGKIQNYTEEDKPLHLIIDFNRNNENVNVKENISGEHKHETFEVWNGKEFWGKYSMEFYKTASATIKSWNGGELSFFIAEKKDMPLLMAYDDFGFVLAPRIENE